MEFKPKEYLQTPKGRRLAKWLIGVPLVYTLFGFLALPAIVRYVAQDQMTKALGRPSTISKVRFNPWTLALEIEDLHIREHDSQDDFVSFKLLRVDTQIMSLFKLAPVIREITLNDPAVRIVRTGDTSFNFTDIIDKLAKDSPPAEPPDPKAKPFRYSVNNITLQGGRVDFTDQPKDSKHTISELKLGVPFISNMPASIEIDVLPAFAAKIDDASFNLKGKTRPFTESKETTVDLNLDDFSLPEYQKYLPENLGFKIQSGKLATQLTFSFLQSGDQKPRITITGTTALKEFEIKDRADADIFKLPLLETNLKSIELFPVVATVERVLIQEPELHVSRDRNGIINLTKLIPPSKPDKANPAPTTAQKDEPAAIFSVAETQLKNGRVSWKDQVPESGFSTEITPIDLTVTDLGNQPKQTAKVELNLATNTGETLKHQGTLTLTPIAAHGGVEVGKVGIPNFAPYLAGKLPFKIEEGQLAIKSNYSFEQGEPANIKAEGLDVMLRTLRLRQPDSDHDFFNLPEFHVAESSIDVPKQAVVLGSVTTNGGKLDVRRSKEGQIDLAAMAPPPTVEPANPDTVKPATNAEQNPSWTVNLNKFELQKYGVSLQDAAIAKPITTNVEPIDINLSGFSTAPGNQSQVDLKLEVNKKGTLAVAGPLRLQPLNAQMKIDLKGFELVPLRGYVPDNVKLILTGGTVATAGNAQIEKTADEMLKIHYGGNAAVNKFATVEKASSQQDLLKWNSLAVNGIDFQAEPLSIALKEVKLDGLFSAVKLGKDGAINLANLVEPNKSAAKPKPPENPEPNDSKASTATRIDIDKIKLTDSTIAITDQQVSPNYTAKLVQLEGNVGKISSTKSDPTPLALKAMLDGHSPLEVTGNIKPLAQDLFADVKIAFKDIDVNPFSPYTVKFVGYPLQQGKLSLDLKYLLDKHKLDSHNQVFLDQLQLGNKVESPSAASLPVETAVSLLKNRNGAIKLDLPVQGSLDDPSFSVLGILGDVLVNLITKAAIAPFSLISSAFGGGEDLGFVEFERGNPTLTQSAKDKLDKLAEALADRPELKVEIVSKVDAEADKTGAIDYGIQQQVLAQKRAEMIDQGKPADSLAELKVAPEEYEKYLTLAYGDAEFKKPRNFIGIAKTLPREEMEKLMRENTTISNDDLKQLGVHRAEAVRDFLIQQKIDNGRIFLGETSVAPADKDNSGSRVNFVIK